MAKRKQHKLVYQFRDKDFCIERYRQQLLNKTMHIFQYEGLPSSIPERELEKILQTTGNCTIASVNGILYAFDGKLGDRLDEYYRPTASIVSNPYLEFYKELKIDDECVVIHNNSTWTPVYHMADRYITQMVENDVTQNLANISTRMSYIINCSDDDDKIAADRFIQNLMDGELEALCADGFFGAIQTQPFGNNSSNSVTQLIEYAQWLRGSLLNEFGITDNLNIKREYVNSDELAMYNEPIKPLVFDMLYTRQEAVEKINNMFGTSISVKVNPIYLPESVVDHEETSDEPFDDISVDEEVTEDAEH